MSSLNINQIKEILNKHQDIKDVYKNYKYDCFIETGTHVGTTVLSLHSYFKNIISIEISKGFYDYCTGMLQHNNITNVKLYNGDSSIVMKDILKDVREDVIYFLDGHYSHEDTGRGEKDVPLIEELKIINDRNNNDIIIIDDYRLFGTSNAEDWSNITIDSILNSISKERVFKYFDLNDRFCIFLRKV